MLTARILHCTLIVVAIAAGVFALLAGAQASSLPQPAGVTGATPQPVRVVEVIREKPANHQARPRLMKERVKAMLA